MLSCTNAIASFDTATRWAMFFALALMRPREVLVTRTLPRRVERRHHRRRMQQHRRHRRPRSERLVQVEHVELFLEQHPHRAQCCRRVGGQRGHRSVRRGRQAVAERGHERGRRRAVARPQHSCLDAHRAQLAGEAHHLGLHAAGDREAVRAEHPDAQRPLLREAVCGHVRRLAGGGHRPGCRKVPRCLPSEARGRRSRRRRGGCTGRAGGRGGRPASTGRRRSGATAGRCAAGTDRGTAAPRRAVRAATRRASSSPGPRRPTVFSSSGIASTVPYRSSSVDALRTPHPGTPGRPSLRSPTRANRSGI